MEMSPVTGGKESSESSSDEEQEDHPCINWSGLSKSIPVFLFYPEAVVSKDERICSVGERYHMAFKIVRTESRLVRGILTNHGFHEVHPNNNDFNLLWTGSHLKPYILRSLQDFQKVNHFPRSYELTRKDRLYKNIQRMQQTHGFKYFHIVPQTFVLPSEYPEFCNCFAKDKGLWIIKPVASSRGRGIYLVSNPNQISMDENTLVSRYINNPLLIDEFKFDMRLYVLITSYDPLLIYVYEEGLARFATVRYDRTSKNIKNTFMHLTNYSVNKKSSDYVSCDDPEVEDYGNKWSMSAVLRYLKQEGKDTTLLMRQVEDLIVKAVLSAQLQIAAACEMFVPHKTNCFELYGFDVLVDSNLKPWLLEVNLSPSLACDAPLDLKIKASMIADMFSLVGFVCQDPHSRQPRSDRVTLDPGLKHPAAQRAQSPASASNSETEASKDKQSTKQRPGNSTLNLRADEIKVLRRIQEEDERRGGFIRIFPTAETWELYGGYLESKTSMNYMLANRLFHGRNVNGNVQLQVDAVHGCHVVQYERKLLSLEARKRKQRHLTHRSSAGKKKLGRESKASLTESGSIQKREERAQEEKEEVKQVLEPVLRKALVAEQRKQVATPLEWCHSEAPSSSEVATHKPRVNLLSILQQGWDLSKVQARMAFSSYLQRVQQRLLAESRTNTIPAWPDKDNDQMELVIRFLRRAAHNLQQNIKVVLPSRQLPLQDRRRILSNQLGEFIHCYNKETEHMLKKQENSKEEVCVNPLVFQEYITSASENDLEEILTFYTQKNKSATIFLGTKVRSVKKDSEDSVSYENSQFLPMTKEDSSALESSLSTGKVSSDPDIKDSESQPSVRMLSEDQQAVVRTGSKTVSTEQLNHVLRRVRSFTSTTTGASSSITSAMHIYSQKLCRPTSAGQVNSRSSSSKLKSNSVGAFKELNSLSAQVQSNQQAFISTLQKLADNQAACHSASSNHINLLTQHLTNLNLASRVLGRESFTLNPKVQHTAAMTQRPVKAIHSGTELLSSAGALKDEESHGDGKMQNAYSLVTGVNPQQHYQPPQGSYQLQFAIHQLQQQNLQSRQLQDQSHCRHQAQCPDQTSVPDTQKPTDSSSCPPSSFHVWSNPSHSQNHIQTCVRPVLAPKPPHGAREGLIRKTATKRLIKQTSSEGSASGSVSSSKHMIYKAICGKTGLSVYRKLFQGQEPSHR
uniref:tubulin polyglutamylase TTLL5 isoform X3 n=1 Tax=Monopterus albus TaxID=43700 RepID=UPI0009B41194|nr:tubulin polyglutamylase TTLL5 isoform X3 [Monopterus albus]